MASADHAGEAVLPATGLGPIGGHVWPASMRSTAIRIWRCRKSDGSLVSYLSPNDIPSGAIIECVDYLG